MIDRPDIAGVIDLKWVWRNRETGRTGGLLDVADAGMAVHHLRDWKREDRPCATPWPALERVDVEENLEPWAQRVFAGQTPQRDLSEDRFLDEYIAAYTAAVDRLWDPENVNVLFATSGWDTRFLAAVVRRMATRCGEGKLGRVILTCYGPEAAGAEEWISADEWGELDSAYMAMFHASTEADPEVLDFRTAWDHLGGVQHYEHNILESCLIRLRHVDWINQAHRSGNLVAWSGQLTDLLTPLPIAQRIRMRCRDYMSAQAAGMKCPMICPITAREPMELLASMPRTAQRLDYDRFSYLKISLLRRIAPHLLRFRKRDEDLDAYRPRARTIPDDLLAAMQRDYDASWYGRHVAPEVVLPASMYRSRAWLHWSTASCHEAILGVAR